MSDRSQDDRFYQRLLDLQTALVAHSPLLCGDAPLWFIDSFFLPPLSNWIEQNSPSNRVPNVFGLQLETEDWCRGCGRAMTETIDDDRCFEALARFRRFLGVRTAAEILADAEREDGAQS